MKARARILVVDDDPGVAKGVGMVLSDEGYAVERVENAAAAFLRLTGSGPPPDLVLLDIRMPGETGLELLARLPRPLPAPVVVLSGEASANEAVQALKLGATDFVEKPPSPERLVTAVRNALALGELSQERERLVEALAAPGNLVGKSPATEALRAQIAQVAPTDAVVLITGETGTGKERVARALHLASGRTGRFVAVNCAAIPETLLESELFGHEKGAFSGAVARRLGRIEQARDGTLLLDEVGDMPLALQAKLLRVIQEREVERLGGSGPVPVDVRFLAATHRDLLEMVRAGTFREDLYYRLAVFPIAVAPLRDRPGDLFPLLAAFVAELAGDRHGRGAGAEIRITAEGEAALLAYRWPGNVRELRNLAERLTLVRGSGPIVVDGAVSALLGPAGTAAAAPPAALGAKPYRELVEDFERTTLGAALERCGGNVAEAARLLQMDRGNLFRKLKALGLVKDSEG